MGETFLVIHVEIQDGKETEFSLRMYNYYYRIWDQYRVPVICLAVFTDKDENWRPDSYETEMLNCRLKFNYPIVKLIDYESQLEMLETSENPFALVVLCQLAALKSKNNVDLRKLSKYNLTKSLFKKTWSRDKIISLLKFLDGILRMPEQVERALVKVLKDELKEDPKMSYMTSFEYFARLEGFEEGIQTVRQNGIQAGIQMAIQTGIQRGIQTGEARVLLSQLQSKFKMIPEYYTEQIEKAHPDILLTWANRLLTAKTIEEIFE